MFGLLWSVIPTFTNLDYGNSEIIWFCYVYLVGGYIRLHQKRTARNNVSNLWMSVFIYSIIFVPLIVLGISGADEELIKKTLEHLSWDNCIFVLLSTVCLFRYFVNKKQNHNRMINFTASTVTAVYLIHDSQLIRSSLWNHFFHVPDFLDSPWFILYYVFVILSIFVFCSVIEFIRELFFKKIEHRISAQINHLILHAQSRLFKD